jgi:GT2 family glycosyltransferase
MTTLSIVIPSYNRRESLARLVSTLLEQDRADHKVEIVVVLDGSTDGSAETLAEVVVPPGMTLLIRQQPNRGPSAARNAGIADASGEIVLFLDDDMVPLPRFVKSHLEAYRDVQIDGVIGQIKSVSAPCVPPTVATLMENLFDDQHHRLSEEGAAVTAMDVFTGNLSVKRSRLLEVGGFDESLTGLAAEDTDLGHRLLAVGARFVYVPDAVAAHYCTFESQEWRHRVWQEGAADARLSRLRPAIASYLTIDSLNEGKVGRRIAAQFAIQFPRPCAVAHAPKPLPRVLERGEQNAGIGSCVSRWEELPRPDPGLPPAVRPAGACAREIRSRPGTVHSPHEAAPPPRFSDRNAS